VEPAEFELGRASSVGIGGSGHGVRDRIAISGMKLW
jgi:hypothetical protein